MTKKEEVVFNKNKTIFIVSAVLILIILLFVVGGFLQNKSDYFGQVSGAVVKGGGDDNCGDGARPTRQVMDTNNKLTVSVDGIKLYPDFTSITLVKKEGPYTLSASGGGDVGEIYMYLEDEPYCDNGGSASISFMPSKTSYYLVVVGMGGDSQVASVRIWLDIRDSDSLIPTRHLYKKEYQITDVYNNDEYTATKYVCAKKDWPFIFPNTPCVVDFGINNFIDNTYYGIVKSAEFTQIGNEYKSTSLCGLDAYNKNKEEGNYNMFCGGVEKKVDKEVLLGCFDILFPFNARVCPRGFADSGIRQYSHKDFEVDSFWYNVLCSESHMRDFDVTEAIIENNPRLKGKELCFVDIS